jgi:phosphohistidine phosphatase
VELYLVRHAAAEERQAGRPDAERRLTAEGREDFSAGVRGLRALGLSPDRLLTSPLVRAHETARLLAAGLDSPGPEIERALAPGGSGEELLAALRGVGERVVLVGHEPDLGRLLLLAVAGRAGEGAPLKKGGAARIDFEGTPRPGAGELHWLLTPRQLRRLGRAGS